MKRTGFHHGVCQWVLTSIVLMWSATPTNADFVNDLVNLGNIQSNHLFNLAGTAAGVNASPTPESRTRTQTVMMPDGMGGFTPVDIVTGRAQVASTLLNAAGNAAGTKKLRLQAFAEADRTNTKLGLAGVAAQRDTSVIAVAGATADFELPKFVMEGANRKWFRGHKIRIEGSAGGRLEGSVVGGAPLEPWSVTLRRDLGGTPTNFTTFATVQNRVLDSKFRRAAIQSDAVLMGGAADSINVDPQALVNNGDMGPSILTSQPGRFRLTASLRVDARANSSGATEAAHKGSRAVARSNDPPNNRMMDVDVLVESAPAPQNREPKAWQDPLMTFDGTTLHMDNGPLAGLNYGHTSLQFVDDDVVTDPILTALLSDPLSQTLSISPSSLLSISGGLAHFADTAFALTVNNAPVLSGLITDIEASTVFEDNYFEGKMQIGFIDPGASPWLSSLQGASDLRFLFDPEIIRASQGFVSSASVEGVNLIAAVIPEPSAIGLAAVSLLFMRAPRRARR